MTKHAALTIVSKNYLAFAQTLASSYKQHHPDHDFFIVLVDRADGYVGETLPSGAQVVEMADLEIPDVSRFIYRYSIMELNTAVKPFALASLFARKGYETLLYIDPDIRVFEPLTEVYDALETASIVLTPHLRKPFNDGFNPTDLSILQSGTYNLGFIGLRKGKTTDDLLDWWMGKLYIDCVVDLGKGLFVDQKWIDLIPGFFPDHRVLSHPGYNAAYWNLHERPVTREGDRWLVDNQNLAFFHFSGYVPYAPTTLSKHQNRHDLKALPELKALTDAYSKELFSNGYEESHAWPYAFGTLGNGVKLPLRLVALAMQWCARSGTVTPDPVLQPDEFCRFLMSRGVIPGYPNSVVLFHFLLGIRNDVLGAFPGALYDSDDKGFRDWIRSSGVREQEVGDLLLFESDEVVLVDYVGDVFGRIRGAEFDDVLTHFKGMWISPDVFSNFAEWVASEGVAELGFTRTHAERLVAAVPGIARIIHIYFLRGDLQNEFPVLGDRTQIAEFAHWLRNQRLDLELTDGEISLFVEFAVSSTTLLEQMRLLYQHRGLKTRAEPNIYAIDARRFETASRMSRDDILGWLTKEPAIAPADHYISHFGDDGSTTDDFSRAFVSGITPSDSFEFVKKIRSAVSGKDARAPVINVAGYLSGSSGMGESGRSMCKTLESAGCLLRRVTLPNFSIEPSPIPTEPACFGWPSPGADVSIAVANADSAGALESFLPKSFWVRKNVGYWVWETEMLPRTVKDSQRLFDEIWTPSEYSAAAIRKTVGIPVKVLPHTLSLSLLDAARPDRARFGLPADAVLFGFSFDPLSSIERKNVGGLIDAFQRAMSRQDNAYLILKVNGKAHGAYDYERMRARCRSDRILFLDATLDRQANFDFLASLDVYVSLHRSEGFGLTCAEAMALGLPVIASRYSGNLDFMSDGDSLLVPTAIVETDRPFGPYPSGTRWGEPDIDVAAQYMRRMLDRSERQSLGKSARAAVRRTLDPQRVGLLALAHVATTLGSDPTVGARSTPVESAFGAKGPSGKPVEQ